MYAGIHTKSKFRDLINVVPVVVVGNVVVVGTDVVVPLVVEDDNVDDGSRKNKSYNNLNPSELLLPCKKINQGIIPI